MKNTNLTSKDTYSISWDMWTSAIQFLHLTEIVAKAAVKSGNPFFIFKEYESGKGLITLEEYEKATEWSDFQIILPLLFNFYHGIELMLKGFIHIKSPIKNPSHKISELVKCFKDFYSNEFEIIGFLSKYSKIDNMPEILKNFLTDNKISIDNMYESIRYPTDKGFKKPIQYHTLVRNEECGADFLEELARDIKAFRKNTMKLGRSLEV